MDKAKNKEIILVVDDCEPTLTAISELLREYGFGVLTSSSAGIAMSMLSREKIDIVISDIQMPDIDGIQLLDKTRNLKTNVPVILMTGSADLNTAVSAINNGAFDFILKPFDPTYFITTINKAFTYLRLKKTERMYQEELEERVNQRTNELIQSLNQTKKTNREIIQRLTKMAEYRDTDTGTHVSRIGLYANKLAEALNMNDDFVHSISFASAMHDIGKIGIADNILLKPDKLSYEEFEIMKTHTTIGKDILQGSSQDIIHMAESIALNHHEKWDGSGYPRGLKGNEIPIEGMISMLADQYDALRSKRPYKEPFSHEEVFKILTIGNGRTRPDHFRPDVLHAFIELESVFEDIFDNLNNTYYSSSNIIDNQLMLIDF